MATPDPTRLELTRAATEGGANTARYELRGTLDRDGVPGAHRELVPMVGKRSRVQRLELDLAGVTHVDTAGVALVQTLMREGRRRGVEVRVIEPSAVAREALELFLEPGPPADTQKRPWLPERVGEGAYESWRSLVGFFVLAADTMVWSVYGAKRTRRVRRGAMWWEADRIGAQALPIVALLSFLVGLVLALQSAYQLRQFGANIYVANLIAVGMTREMGPLLTAIIIAGRSGAAIAAEIATMAVNEEVDALRTMGLQPVRYIVVPKFQALSLTMPALTVFSIILGIMGGFLVALFYLDISPAAFWNQVASALVIKDVVTGLVKSLAFSWIIVLIAAHRGFQAYGGAEAVGLVTTQSVVSSIFWVIIADAVFSMLFYFG